MMDPPSFSRLAPSTQLSHPILGCDSIQSWKCDYMPTSHVAPKTIDEYISAFSPEVQAVLQRVRQAVCSAAPGAQETISYRIPAFKLNGMLVYFAAFTKHIGFTHRSEEIRDSRKPHRGMRERRAIFVFHSINRSLTA